MFYIIPFARYLMPLAFLHTVGTLLFQGMVPAAQIGLGYAVLAVVLATLAFLFVMSCLAVLAYEDYRPRSFRRKSAASIEFQADTPVRVELYARQHSIGRIKHQT